ncbi:hypothetical protein [Bacillus sp. FJAT-49736]|uniref:hypothetical protein n=1 Tax=Bacillus sp. FJAT-49736 TaxID=2833582 RepID=UPI001BCA2970|nr:hypothetical protein [Bacillus sp. FJAT-49736]MBS4173835.1 hypothetical protein [Bacillus sp. FJAT-49736]
MNFEAKHLIRWGIPGWVYITIVFSYFLIDEKQVVTDLLKEFDISFVGITALLTGSGVIIGHLIHQLSIHFGFVLITNWKKYFIGEYKIDQLIMRNEKGKEIQRIYSYRLGQVHALRALLTSLMLSLLTLIILFVIYDYSIGTTILFTGIFILSIVVAINYHYFKRNLDFFIKEIKKENFT